MQWTICHGAECYKHYIPSNAISIIYHWIKTASRNTVHCSILLTMLEFKKILISTVRGSSMSIPVGILDPFSAAILWMLSIHSDQASPKIYLSHWVYNCLKTKLEKEPNLSMEETYCTLLLYLVIGIKKFTLCINKVSEASATGRCTKNARRSAFQFRFGD